MDYSDHILVAIYHEDTVILTLFVLIKADLAFSPSSHVGYSATSSTVAVYKSHTQHFK